MSIGGWSFLAAIVAGLIGIVIWAVARKATADTRLSEEVRNAQSSKAAADVLVERRDPDAVSGRLRDGSF